MKYIITPLMLSWLSIFSGELSVDIDNISGQMYLMCYKDINGDQMR